MIYSSWDIECDRPKLVIMDHFLPFYPPPPPNKKKTKKEKNQNFEKMKKIAEVSSFYTCVADITIIWGTVPQIRSETQNFLSFWAIFCPFTPLTTQKIKISKKSKKHLEISSFYTCAPKIMIRWCTVPEIWCATDGRADGQTDGPMDRRTDGKTDI